MSRQWPRDLAKPGALRRAALDLLLPPRCAACDAPLDQGIFCPPCGESLVEVVDPCRCCGLPEAAPRCSSCRRNPPPLDRAIAPWVYGGALATALRRLKRHPQLAAILAPLLHPALDRLPPTIDLVLPVPLHPRALSRRGFNQAALLARLSCRRPRLPVVYDALHRIRDTPPQRGQSRQGRWLAVDRAFVARPRRVGGRSVLLIDDVMTTGATANACAGALRQAGAIHVTLLTVARAAP